MEKKKLSDALKNEDVEIILSNRVLELPQMIPNYVAYGMTKRQYERHKRTRARKGRKS